MLMDINSTRVMSSANVLFLFTVEELERVLYFNESDYFIL